MNKNHKYAYRLPYDQDQAGFYMPQPIIDVVLTEAHSIAKILFQQRLLRERLENISPSLLKHRIFISEPMIELDQSKQLVDKAFELVNFSVSNDVRAAIWNASRWNLNSTQVGEASGKCFLPRTEHNPNPYSVIHYEYDRTINDPLYMAHELGHLIAFDSSISKGAIQKRHMSEIQAFLLQHIMYGYLIDYQSDAEIRSAAQDHFCGEIMRSLFMLPIALGALDAEREVEEFGKVSEKSKDRYVEIMQDWLGPNWVSFSKAKEMHGNLNDHVIRDRYIAGLHRHAMASIVSAGLMSLGKEIISAVMSPKEFSITGILDEYDVSTEKLVRDAVSYIQTRAAEAAQTRKKGFSVI